MSDHPPIEPNGHDALRGLASRGGAPAGVTDDALCDAAARRALEAGSIPAREAQRIWGGKGSGLPCAICGERLSPRHVEIEIEFARDVGSWHLHPRCFGAWDVQRRAFAAAPPMPSAPPLPGPRNECTMPLRERDSGKAPGRQG